MIISLLRIWGEDELLDLLDEGGAVIGVVRRGDCHGDPARGHRAVHIMVINTRGEYYLQRRSQAKLVQPGKWDSSVGGHVPRGESYERAALRELQEELGVELADASSLRRSHDYIWRSKIETEHVRTFILKHDGPFRHPPQEIESGRFWTAAELRAAVGDGSLTPNLEEELRRLGIVETEEK